MKQDGFFTRAGIAGRAFLAWIENSIISAIPFWIVRKAYHRMMGVTTGRGSQINMHTYFMGPGEMSVGNFSHINPGCLLDYRGGIKIGSCVSISHRVMLITGGHDTQSSTFQEVHKPITIGDHVWICAGATILQGVEIGDGAVVAAGAVVVNNVPSNTIVGGIPAKKIGERARDLDYRCHTANIFM